MGKIQDILADQSQVNKIAKVVFDQVDTDNSGYVSEGELEVLMKNIANQCNIAPPTKTDVHQAMTAIDKNNDGQVSFDEFKVLVVEILKALAQKGM